LNKIENGSILNYLLSVY